MANSVLTWWGFLCAVAALNALALVFSTAFLIRHKSVMSIAEYVKRRHMLGLSAAYTLGCGFRSAFPIIDVPQICLSDSIVSRVVIGRSVATIAELCFVAQWALLAREIGKTSGTGGAMLVSRLLIPLIAIAEAFSWYAVWTRNNLAHLAENSLWALCAFLLVMSFNLNLPHYRDRQKRFLIATIVCGSAYFAFMIAVDLPMYFARWQVDLASGHSQLSLSEGFIAVLQKCRVVLDWERWREDIPWLTLYFTVGVWFSVALPHVPFFALARNQSAIGRCD